MARQTHGRCKNRTNFEINTYVEPFRLLNQAGWFRFQMFPPTERPFGTWPTLFELRFWQWTTPFRRRMDTVCWGRLFVLSFSSLDRLFWRLRRFSVVSGKISFEIFSVPWRRGIISLASWSRLCRVQVWFATLATRDALYKAKITLFAKRINRTLDMTWSRWFFIVGSWKEWKR